MADKVGASFHARISGVTRFGLFVTLQQSGANGLIPLSSLPDDYWMHDEATQTLNGRRTRQSFRLTQDVSVRLKEASPVTGGLVFDLSSGAADGQSARDRPRDRQGSGKKRRAR